MTLIRLPVFVTELEIKRKDDEKRTEERNANPPQAAY